MMTLAFLSTHSKRSATEYAESRLLKPLLFLSTHSKRSATYGCRFSRTHKRISIHALQTECDLNCCIMLKTGCISIHALQTECDRTFRAYRVDCCRFLSTHSKRSATDLHWLLRLAVCYFYPRTPNGVRRSA